MPALSACFAGFLFAFAGMHVLCKRIDVQHGQVLYAVWMCRQVVAAPAGFECSVKHALK